MGTWPWLYAEKLSSSKCFRPRDDKAVSFLGRGRAVAACDVYASEVSCSVAMESAPSRVQSTCQV